MTFVTKCKAYYESIDQYGVSPQMGIYNEDKRRSTCGSSLSVLVLIATLCMLYISSRDFILKNNPDISSSTTIKKEYEIKRIGPGHDFDFAFQMIDRTGNIVVDHKYVRPSALYFDRGQISLYQVQVCDENNNINAELKGNAWCLTKEIQNANITVSSQFEQVFIVQLDLCINNPQRNFTGCDTEQAVKEKLGVSYLRVFYNGLSIDLNNFQNPIESTFSESYVYTGNDLNRALRLELETITIESDTGFFYSINNEESFKILKQKKLTYQSI